MGNPIIREHGPKTRLVASASTWIESKALDQLERVSTLPGMRLCVGMPDLHPGVASPVGAAFLAEGQIHPELVGSDIGCGMALWTTDFAAEGRKAKPERLAERLDGLDQSWRGDTKAWLAARGLEPTAHDRSLGTPGHGNHFIEILKPHDVAEPESFAALGLAADQLAVLVHTGSRGLGEAILKAHVAAHGHAGVAETEAAAQDYLAAHDMATRWAKANRDLCAHRTLEAIGADGRQILDICHNSVTAAIQEGCVCWLHRKGAAPADCGPVMIPGSRGDLSFLVRPVEGRDEALRSLAHGAGRRIARHDAKAKLQSRYRRQDLNRNPFGGRIVCGDEALLWEEAPECYKHAASVIADLVEAELITVIASFAPVATFKTSAAPQDPVRKAERGGWKRRLRDARLAKERTR